MPAFYPGTVLGSGFSMQADIRLPSVVPPSTTIGTIAAAHGFLPQWNVRADYGYALGASGGVSSIIDLSGNGHDFTEAVDAQQPLWLPSDVNGFPAIQGDGVDDRLTNAFSRGAVVAGTVSTHVWFVLIASQITWTSNDTLISDGGATVYQNTTSGGMRIFGGSSNGPQNNNLIGYKRIIAQFTGNTSAYLQVGSSFTGGSNPGSPVATTITALLAAPGGVRFFNGKIAEAAMGFGDISAGTFSGADGIDAYVSARYGAGVLS